MSQFLNTRMALSPRGRAGSQPSDNCYTHSYDYCYYDNVSGISSHCRCCSRLWRYCLAICSPWKCFILPWAAGGNAKETTKGKPSKYGHRSVRFYGANSCLWLYFSDFLPLASESNRSIDFPASFCRPTRSRVLHCPCLGLLEAHLKF